MKLFSIQCDARENQKIQDGGSQTGEILISACIYNITAKCQRQHPCSQGGIQLFPILCEATRWSRKFKMAPLKQGQLIYHYVCNVAAQLYPCILRLRNSAELFPILCYASRRQQSKLADLLLIDREYSYHTLCNIAIHSLYNSHSLYNIARQFQQLFPRHKIKKLNGSILYHMWCKRKAKIQDGGSHTRNTHVCETPRILTACNTQCNEYLYWILRPRNH